MKMKPVYTPTQLCFSLWLRGFVNAALTIYITLSVLSLFGLGLGAILNKYLNEHFLFNLTTLLLGVVTFSAISTGFIALLVGLRYFYIRFSIMGLIAALIVLPGYMSLGSALISFVEKQDWKAQAGIIAISVVILLVIIGSVAGIKNAQTGKNKENKPRQKMTPRDFISWHWLPSLHEDVKEIYLCNKKLEPGEGEASNVCCTAPPANIGSDFKAWNDATKLLITIMTGLTVILAIFSGGNSQSEHVLKIIALLFLLVPGLCCAYMEAFRRQCERQWHILEMS
jgi:hypothetical protein